MWDKVKNWVSENFSKALGIPTVLSGLTFLTNVLQSLSDGHLSGSEMQSLISGSSGLETLILAVLMFFFRK
jgi:hypothetical protein